jgi:hypothetical protein
LAVWYLIATARAPYEGRVLCPPDGPRNWHDIGAPWPLEPWAVAAGFLAILIVAIVARLVLDRRG